MFQEFKTEQKYKSRQGISSRLEREKGDILSRNLHGFDEEEWHHANDK